MTTKDLIICSLFAALTAVLAQISIPLPGGVPLTMQTLAVSLAGIILGAKRGFISVFIYVLLGTIGIPVFANFAGGLQIILGPTGGFLLSFPIMAYVIGFICEKTSKTTLIFLGMVLGSIINYIIGAAQFSLVTNSTLTKAFMLCVVPFIIVGLVKAFLATTLGVTLKKRNVLREI